MRIISAMLVAFLAVPSFAQEAPKPGPEHDMLKKRVGTWDTVMSVGGSDSKGTVTYKMDLGGLWLSGAMESDLGGQKFSGRSLDSYDATKKKYVSVWVDSMGTTPMLMEGDWDATKKALTMSGEGPGMDGKPAKWKSITTFPDADTEEMKMFVGDAKEAMFSITYKRKK